MKGQPQPTIARRARSAAFGKAAIRPPSAEVRASSQHHVLKDHQIALPRDYFSPYTYRQ